MVRLLYLFEKGNWCKLLLETWVLGLLEYARFMSHGYKLLIIPCISFLNIIIPCPF